IRIDVDETRVELRSHRLPVAAGKRRATASGQLEDRVHRASPQQRSARRNRAPKKVHGAGGGFIHRFRWLSDWALRPSPYNPRMRLRLTPAPCSVQAAT